MLCRWPVRDVVSASIHCGDMVRLGRLRRSPNPAAVLPEMWPIVFLDMSAQAGPVLLGFCSAGSVPMALRNQARHVV